MPVVGLQLKGGLGNQLFQIATAFNYAKMENGTLQIARHTHKQYWDSILENVKSYVVDTIPNSLSVWTEKEETTYTKITPLGDTGCLLRGYFQSSQYFPDCQSELKQLFTNQKLVAAVTSKYEKLCANAHRVIVLHARRGDYLTFKEKMGPLPIAYYKKALAVMLPAVHNPLLVLSSDDNSFWKQLKPVISQYEQHIVEETDVATFYLLQQFHYFIMANSTFIWWCVYLANATTVITPAKWFGPAGPRTADIHEPGWVKVSRNQHFPVSKLPMKVPISLSRASSVSKKKARREIGSACRWYINCRDSRM